VRIAIEAFGIDKPGGGRSATLNVLEALFTIDKRNCYFVFLNQGESRLDIPSANVNQIVLDVKNRFLARIWAQLVLPPLLRWVQADLVHFAKNLGTLLTPGKTVVTIYDLAILLYPDIYPIADVVYWRLLEPLTLRKADRVIAISHRTAHDLRKFYGVAEDRIAVIYPSYSPVFQPADKATVARVRQVYGLPRRTIIHVGSISSKKNLTTLVKAFHLLKRGFGFDGKLVLVGRAYRKGEDERLRRQIVELGLEKEVIFTGPVPDADLPSLYSSATLAAFPSLYEGFGIASLEAMACGVPVITSRAGGVAEVVDDAALFVEDASSEDEWATAMSRITRDRYLWEEMTNKGIQRAKHFSAAKAALQTLNLYEELVS
jgi:glycosyltransferase involved in cell wall biosynthesis